jgi:thiol-disulfide isomerase/thioredoxin
MKSLRRLAALALGGAVAFVGCSGGATSGNSYRFDGATTLGSLITDADRKPVPDFKASLLDGGTFNLARDGGKVTVVNFWGTWCGPCTVETPQFGLVYDKYRHEDVAFVGIDVKEAGRDDPRAFVTANKIHYPIVFDEDGETAVRLGNIPTQAMPFTVILDKRHRVAAVYLVRLGASDLEPVLNKLIAEK